MRLLLRLNALVGVGFGLGLLLIPKPLLDLYGVATTDAIEAVARLYGAELLGFSVATWLAADQRSAWRPVLAGHVTNESLTAVVAALVVVTGVAGGLLWSIVVLAGGFAIASAMALRATSAVARHE